MMLVGSWVGRFYMPEKEARITKARGCSFKAFDFPRFDRHEDGPKIIQILLGMGPCTYITSTGTFGISSTFDHQAKD